MARASIPTLLPLDSWAKILGINPWTFNQFATDLPVAITTQCNDAWYQHQWQKDFLSREEVAQAIDAAEQLIAEQVSFYPAPKYIENELNEPRQPRDHGVGRVLAPSGQWKPLSTKYMYVREAGKILRTLLDIDAAVVYSAKIPTFEETFTITVTTANVENADQIGVYFIEADRLDEAIDETWRVRPVKVAVSGTTVTITGHKARMVKPEKAETYEAVKLSATTAANFVTEVAVYRVTTDQTNTAANPAQGIASWDPPPGCEDDCVVKTGPVCLSNYNADAGVVRMQLKSADRPFAWQPDRVHINYLAGLPLENGDMNRAWARAVTYLSVTLVAGEKCGCERSNRAIRWWRMLPSSSGATSDARPITPREVDMNPLISPRRGAKYAWNFIEREVGDSFGY